MKKLKSISKVRAKQMREYAKLKRAFLDQHRYCECCGRVTQSLTVHHTRGRVGKLLTIVELWRAVCARCHDWIHAHPAAARDSGLLCEQGQWNTIPK